MPAPDIGYHAQRLLWEYNLYPPPETLYEEWLIEDYKRHFRFAKKNSQMRVLVMYDPDLDT